MTPTGTVSGNKGGNLANHIKNKLDTASGTTDDSLAWKPREPEEGTGDSLPEDNAFSFQEEAGVSDSFEDFIEEAKEERSKGMGQGVKIFLIVCAGLAAAGGGASAILLYTGSRAQRSRALTKKNQGGKKHKKKHKKG